MDAIPPHCLPPHAYGIFTLSSPLRKNIQCADLLPQMMELLRSQAVARAQNQQQLNNQFGLSPQQMLNGGPQGGSQQQPSPSFLDNQQQQSHLQPPFPATTPGSNAPQIQQSMPRNAMIQAFQANPGAHANNPNTARQLEALFVQNQQQQNGPLNLSTRMEQQRHQQQLQNMNHSSPPDLFHSPAMADRRPSPAHPNSQVAHTISGSQPPQQPQQPRRQLTLVEVTDRANALRVHITQLEGNMNQFTATRGSSPDASFLSRVKAMHTEIGAKKEYLAKLEHAAQNLYAHLLSLF